MELFLFGSNICVEEFLLVGGIGEGDRLTVIGEATEVTIGGLDSEKKTTSADSFWCWQKAELLIGFERIVTLSLLAVLA
ncbi:hypothetical protein TNCT_642201 [Trichonephila clavata]|uniref:Uncharacterized protein n=1 Tax=Trichonephila clavata TaxID=2740835 RepID=A0A8X6KC05_TRICU|nr:hypothetical protein TNCT_642201 [Trichonephila clavata]